MSDFTRTEEEPTRDAPADPRRKVYWAGPQWCVTDYGLETVEPGRYYLAASDLGALTDHAGAKNEPIAERIRHLSEKSWVDVEDLFAAFAVAVIIHGVDLRRGALLNAMGDARRGRWMDKARRRHRPPNRDGVYTMSELMGPWAKANADLHSYLARTGRNFQELDDAAVRA